MSLYYGNTKIGSLYLGSDKIKEAYYGNVKVFGSGSSLAPYTMRFRFGSSATDPTTVEWENPHMAECWTKVESITDDNVWDFHDESSDWSGYFAGVFIDDGFDILDANLTGVTQINGMFASSGIASISNFYTPDITECASLFNGCTSLWRVSLFDTSNVTDMTEMFSECTSLESVPLFDTSNVTDMSYMFAACTSLKYVPLFDTSSVAYMSSMFYGCLSLKSVPLFDTSSVDSMTYMFNGCTSLESAPLFNTSSVTTMLNMFNGCSSLTSIPLFNTANVTDMASMFQGCENVETGALALYQQASTQATPPSSHSKTFRDCGSNTTTGAAELAQIPNDWQ